MKRTSMKSSALRKSLLAIGLCAAAGVANAQDPTLAPVVVERANGARMMIDCAPPSGDPACARFHELIRQNFSEREIGMLFGASTAYLEYPASYDRVRTRYVAFLNDIAMNGLPVETSYRYSY